MSYIKKPGVTHPFLTKNKLDLSRRDYDGHMSTLCAGCGHDSVSSALSQAYFELSIEPSKVVKTSGIGCSSKTPTYFLRDAHGFNSVHGRMPSVACGANAANRTLHYIGVSGDGDSLSIGFGQFAHAIRRNLNMVYIIENNGVYGLTKGQFSASADLNSPSKKGELNNQPPIDPVCIALALSCTFIARSFSGDKEQLIPLLKAAIMHKGFAMLDVISPCVTFNNHKLSTKSYHYTREYVHELVHTDYVPAEEEITTSYQPGECQTITLHDGSQVQLRKLNPDYDPTDYGTAFSYIKKTQAKGEIVTGLLYINENSQDMHDANDTCTTPLVDLPYSTLCPGSKILDEIQEGMV